MLDLRFIDDLHDWTIDGINIGTESLDLTVRSEHEEVKRLFFKDVSRLLINNVLPQNVILEFKVLDPNSDSQTVDEKRRLLDTACPGRKVRSKYLAVIESSVGADAIVECENLRIDDL